MKTRLTLVLDKEVAKKAKALSRRRNKNISDIIEQYLKQITNKEGSVVDKLLGAAKGTYPENTPYEQIVRESISEVYQRKKLRVEYN